MLDVAAIAAGAAAATGALARYLTMRRYLRFVERVTKDDPARADTTVQLMKAYPRFELPSVTRASPPSEEKAS